MDHTLRENTVDPPTHSVKPFHGVKSFVTVQQFCEESAGVSSAWTGILRLRKVK